MKRPVCASVMMLALASTSAFASAPEERSADSAWSGGLGLTSSAGSHVLGIGVTVAARYSFVQLGGMAFAGMKTQGALATLGLVGTIGEVEVGLDGMFGGEATDTGPLMQPKLAIFGGECTTDWPRVTAKKVGAMLTISRSLRAGAPWIGGGASLVGPARTVEYTTTTTCTGPDMLGNGRDQTTTSQSTETLDMSGGLFFRVGFRIL